MSTQTPDPVSGLQGAEQGTVLHLVRVSALIPFALCSLLRSFPVLERLC